MRIGDPIAIEERHGKPQRVVGSDPERNLSSNGPVPIFDLAPHVASGRIRAGAGYSTNSTGSSGHAGSLPRRSFTSALAH
jgi:hypothetical protein